MTRFSATINSEAVVAAERDRIWAVIVDPTLLAKLTPLLSTIDANGDLWTWHMVRIAALGVGIVPKFTEKMVFDEGRSIDYSHQPPSGVTEWAGANGHYQLADVKGGTKLTIKLTLHIELPLPKLAAPAVTRVMRSTMQRTGERFAVNLLRHLGIDPSTSRR